MMTRLALFDLIARRRLDAATASGLWRLAGFERAPRSLVPGIRRGLVVLGAGFAGLGLVFWVAANWGVLGRLQQFLLLQGLVAVLCGAGALWPGRPGIRVAAGLLAFVAVGGLFAYFGQAYQTGADTWQLFALWAALGLPLALGARADSIWTAWIAVALAAVALWDGAHSWLRWRWTAQAPGVHAAAALCMALLAAAMGKPCRRFTGAGPWAHGMALVLSGAFVTWTGMSGVLGHSSGYYMMCLALGAVAAALVAYQKPFDVLAASVVGLALNVLLVTGLAVAVGSGAQSNWVLPLLVIGGAAAGLLALTVKAIVDLARASAEGSGQA